MVDGIRASQLLILIPVCWACSNRGFSNAVSDESPEQVLARLGKDGRAVDATLGGGQVRYLGFEAAPNKANPGEEMRLTHYWVANAPLNRPYRVFVHYFVQGATGWLAHGDHLPVPGPDHWPVGKVVRDGHPLFLPEALPAGDIELRVGLYTGDERLFVDRDEQHDGQNRIRAGRFEVTGTAVPIPIYRAPKLKVAPTLDGRIDDVEWGGAPWIDHLTTSRGDRPSALNTRIRVAWDASHVYVAWDAEDEDLQATFRLRDDPVYREEAVELFIDPSRSGRDYVELQTSPAGVIFDSSFEGGPRSNPTPSFNADFAAAVAADGTLNNPKDRDRGFRAEWRIGVASLPGAKEPLLPGVCWRANFFRIAKDRGLGRTSTDESAWSPPLMGDFHNLERFGELCFTDAP